MVRVSLAQPADPIQVQQWQAQPWQRPCLNSQSTAKAYLQLWVCLRQGAQCLHLHALLLVDGGPYGGHFLLDCCALATITQLLPRRQHQRHATQCWGPHGAGRPPGLAKRVIACLDVRANDTGDLVVTKGDQYDVRDSSTAGREVRNLGMPVDLAGGPVICTAGHQLCAGCVEAQVGFRLTPHAVKNTAQLSACDLRCPNLDGCALSLLAPSFCAGEDPASAQLKSCFVQLNLYSPALCTASALLC